MTVESRSPADQTRSAPRPMTAVRISARRVFGFVRSASSLAFACVLTAMSTSSFAKEAPTDRPLIGTPQVVKDLHWGDVLFYFYQGEYLSALTRLSAGQDFDRLTNHSVEIGRAHV